ncbi:hypothetical protein COW36_19025 [bacterium (Candidatus Blackallbacteria) CG17_big_fil_post_rev_8_21_14_2_50_48_46]|uniref:Fibronectin type-III domain-containing protein n=1 Tax=bacterium (Candidatus Blackallbacteria) CG17_big_fil_post_rev_8_21_14_2_50_48_46 TaxID=2014261 RepID=A0A2M7G002_9BACT|nr:MAG: hypothetical protein COW64_25445 [bacterium (Candidatus Blackallbacteria) CG18_big_fil_WC_8_21_14_2_50_49_26]PIW15020.1 MAG: hypothetical protein COW36_19025 [bacterium (Candidatus Blackallbacteria) CG17_big_fil_post_rev_8_21_14_2_50_48_46]PIW44837.1 MAG: hypothetical protein COW20_22655 [bacterium (Candidatus Blackallbacteria) CG13_big_fil_rev_8_21_14_2_50_49_14]
MTKRFLWVGAALLFSCQASSLSSLGPLVRSQDHALIWIVPGPSPRLQIAIQYPQMLPLPRGFRTQAVDCARFSRFQVSVVGAGIAQTLYPAGADAGQNHSIPATGCTLNTTLTQVPSGEARVARIIPYDATGAEIPGLTLSAVFDITHTPTTVELSYRSSPAGLLVYDLLTSQNNPLMATHLDRAALQTLVDTVTGAQGSFPNYTYTTHPFLVDRAEILQDLLANGGNIAALNPHKAGYTLATGSIQGSLSGLVASDQVNLRLMDPLSSVLQNQGNGAFSFNQVPPGTWKLELTAPAGYTHTAPATVTVTEGGTLDLGNLVFTPSRPVISSLGASSGAQGDTLLITGSQFHASAAGNTVKFGNTTIPSSDITVLSSTQLRVKIPTVPLGDTTVSVSVGTQTAVNTPAFRIVPPTPLNISATNLSTSGFTLNWGAVTGAESYRIYQNGVLLQSVNAPQTQLNMTGLSAASLYNMQVSALVGGVESALSQTLEVATLSNWVGWGSVGLGSENIQALAALKTDSQVVWAGSAVAGASQGGVWKCTASGGTDSCVNRLAGATSGTVQALAIHPTNAQILLAGTQSQGIYRSNDGGAHWSVLGAAAGLSHLDVRALAIDARSPDTIYAGTYGGGVFVSKDAGLSWASVSTGLQSQKISSLSLFYPAAPNATLLYAGSYGAGVHRASADTVASTGWTTINNGLSFASGFFLSGVDVRALVAHPTVSARLYGGGLGGCFINFVCTPPGGPSGGYFVGVWQREDPGNWVQIGRDATHGYPLGSSGTGLDNMDVLALAIDPVITQNVYVATRGGIFRSTNGGSAWAQMGTGLANPSLEVNTIAVNPVRLYMGTTAGVFRAQ